MDTKEALDILTINKFVKALQSAGLQSSGIASKILHVRNFVDFLGVKATSTSVIKKTNAIIAKLKIYFNKFAKLKHAEAKHKKQDIEWIFDHMDWVMRMTGSKFLQARYSEHIENSKERSATDGEYTSMRRFLMMQLLYK